MNDQTQHIINTYSTIPLCNLPKDSLLQNRIDTKYTLHENQLEYILDNCKDDYSIVTVNGHRLCRYETKYYDSSDLKLYHHHHAGHANRLKIRLRRYVETDNYFLEVKHRNNKGRTLKPRISVECGEQQPLTLLSNKSFRNIKLLPAHLLHETIQINYNRITLVSKCSAERVTIDTNLEFMNGCKKATVPGLVIAEVKQDKCCSSAFTQIMSDLHLKTGSISKYCFGIMYLYNVKNNLFRESIRQIQKSTNYHVFTTSY